MTEPNATALPHAVQELKQDAEREAVKYADMGYPYTAGIIRALLRALEGRAQAPAPDWQPIETAPKGEALLYRPDMHGRDRIQIRRAHDWCGPLCCPHAKPTHWLPLPAPPSTGAATGDPRP